MRHAVVAIVRDAERVLVIRRGPRAIKSGYWAPLSGRLEPGESQEEAVVREVYEEVGLHVRALEKVWECPTDDGTYLLHWWTVVVLSGELVPEPGEVSEARWVHAEEYFDLEPTFEGDHAFFERILPNLE